MAKNRTRIHNRIQRRRSFRYCNLYSGRCCIWISYIVDCLAFIPFNGSNPGNVRKNWIGATKRTHERHQKILSKMALVFDHIHFLSCHHSQYRRQHCCNRSRGQHAVSDHTPHAFFVCCHDANDVVLYQIFLPKNCRNPEMALSGFIGLYHCPLLGETRSATHFTSYVFTALRIHKRIPLHARCHSGYNNFALSVFLASQYGRRRNVAPESHC